MHKIEYIPEMTSNFSMARAALGVFSLCAILWLSLCAPSSSPEEEFVDKCRAMAQSYEGKEEQAVVVMKIYKRKIDRDNIMTAVELATCNREEAKKTGNISCKRAVPHTNVGVPKAVLSKFISKKGNKLELKARTTDYEDEDENHVFWEWLVLTKDEQMEELFKRLQSHGQEKQSGSCFRITNYLRRCPRGSV